MGRVGPADWSVHRRSPRPSGQNGFAGKAEAQIVDILQAGRDGQHLFFVRARSCYDLH